MAACQLLHKHVICGIQPIDNIAVIILGKGPFGKVFTGLQQNSTIWCLGKIGLMKLREYTEMSNYHIE